MVDNAILVLAQDNAIDNGVGGGGHEVFS